MRLLKKWYRQIDKLFLAINLVAFVFFLLWALFCYREYFCSDLFPDSNSFTCGALAGASVIYGAHVFSALMCGLVRALDNRIDGRSADPEVPQDDG